MLDSLEILGLCDERTSGVLNNKAVGLLARLQREFGPARARLLADRVARQGRIDNGERPAFLPETASVRDEAWTVPPAPRDLADRRVEITGPTDAKMMINALNSGAKVFMADLEDSATPTWANMVTGQANLADAVRGRLTYQAPGGREYAIAAKPAVLMVRPRGWHLSERHVTLDGQAVSASLFDVALYLSNNAHELLARGSGPYLYLPKLQGHREAGVWRQVLDVAEEHLGLPSGSIRATVLVETILAAFEMEEILHALGNHATGLNAGRWDYLFSVIKTFRHDPEFVLPDRSQVTMMAPFMRSYTELLVATCHRRGAHAMGGMAAFVPSRHDTEANERAFKQVRADKEREAVDGCDGTWVAHPDLVPIAMSVFDEALAGAPNQLRRQRDDVKVDARALLDVSLPESTVTQAGVRNNVAVCLRYVEAWLRGSGAVAIDHLMEDAATAEMARVQLWQWRVHEARMDSGEVVSEAMIRRFHHEELDSLKQELSKADLSTKTAETASSLFEAIALGVELPEFLTVLAYEEVD